LQTKSGIIKQHEGSFVSSVQPLNLRSG
jgi:hypothetical protein